MPALFRSPHRLFLFIAVVMIATPAWSASLDKKKWIEVRSEHFTIRSRLGKRESVDMLRHMELLHNVVGRSGAMDTAAGVPTVIYAVKSSREFSQIGADDRYVGMFIPGLRRNLIVMHGMRGPVETLVIQHEYVHHLMNNADGFNYPKWYREGWADYLGGFSIKRDKAKLFGPQTLRASELLGGSWLPAEDILDSSAHASLSEREASMFYAQSWLLVHFLGSRKPPEYGLSTGIPRFFRFRAKGLDEVASFEQATGIAAVDLNERLRLYMNRECCAYAQVDVAELLPDFEPVISTPNRADIALGLGEIALEFENLDGADEWFTSAAQSDSTRARATAGLGKVLAARGDDDSAESLFESAATMAPDDHEVQLDRSNFWLERALDSDDADRYEYLAAAASGYEYIQSLGGTTPELLVSLSRVWLEQDIRPNKVVSNLEAATALMPSNVGAHADLAIAYTNVDRYRDAIRILDMILAWSHGDDRIGDWATSLKQQIEAYL